MDIRPVTIEGRWVRLEALEQRHFEPFCETALAYPVTWQWSLSKLNTAEAVKDHFNDALQGIDDKRFVAFATIERETGRFVGSTRFCNIRATNRGVEIGWTWIAPPWQRTAINTEAKFLMLRHAFEVWKCVRVEFMTDEMNVPSRRALARIGAREEGIMHSYNIDSNGAVRNTVLLSITDNEWPETSAKQQALLRR